MLVDISLLKCYTRYKSLGIRDDNNGSRFTIKRTMTFNLIYLFRLRIDMNKSVEFVCIRAANGYGKTIIETI